MQRLRQMSQIIDGSFSVTPSRCESRNGLGTPLHVEAGPLRATISASTEARGGRRQHSARTGPLSPLRHPLGLSRERTNTFSMQWTSRRPYHCRIAQHPDSFVGSMNRASRQTLAFTPISIDTFGSQGPQCRDRDLGRPVLNPSHSRGHPLRQPGDECRQIGRRTPDQN